jgi:hypothetical protein
VKATLATATLDVACPKCSAAPGVRCALPMSALHRERTTEAARITRDANRAARSAAS